MSVFVMIEFTVQLIIHGACISEKSFIFVMSSSDILLPAVFRRKRTKFDVDPKRPSDLQKSVL